jgi:hypothetical protein
MAIYLKILAKRSNREYKGFKAAIQDLDLIDWIRVEHLDVFPFSFIYQLINPQRLEGQSERIMNLYLRKYKYEKILLLAIVSLAALIVKIG